MTKVKICGITNLEDAELSVKFGADSLGFNFYAKSPRYITPNAAAKIIAKLPEEVLKVGVFVNATLGQIVKTAAVAGLDAIQLHGEESPVFLRKVKEQTKLEVIKAFRVSPDFKPEDVLQFDADAILLDAYNPKEHGGTGETFDWKIATKVKAIVPKLYLAGGLGADNVSEATRKVTPFAVDTCSRVEREKGKKDKRKLFGFIRGAKKDFEFKINDIYDLLLLIEMYPAIYLGPTRLNDLCMFLWGIRYGLRFAKADRRKFDWRQFWTEDEPSDVHGFQGFVNRKILRTPHSAYHWSFTILEHCKGDEEAAFIKFFELLEKFKSEYEKPKTSGR